MNFHKAKILLDKINRLYQGMQEDQSQISPIEKDLMLTYLKAFYELFYWEQKKSGESPEVKATDRPPFQAPIRKNPPQPKPAEKKPKPPKPELTPAPPKPKADEAKTPPAAPPQKQEPEKQPPKPATPPKVEQKTPEKPVGEEQKTPPEPPKRPIYKPTPKAPTPPTPSTDEEMEALFETKKATELSEKLGLSPIEDLNRAFGLNDRILYTNELFNGENHTYKETMTKLNALDNMQQAKRYLIEHVAKKHNWTDKRKQVLAKTFIRTVRRKYV